MAQWLFCFEVIVPARLQRCHPARESSLPCMVHQQIELHGRETLGKVSLSSRIFWACLPSRRTAAAAGKKTATGVRADEQGS